MRDGGAIILFIFGLVTSLQFIARYIIDPYIRRKNGEKIDYSEIKVIFSVSVFLFSLILIILDLLGFFEYH